MWTFQHNDKLCNYIVAYYILTYYHEHMIKERLDRNFGLILHDVARLLSTEFDRRVREIGLTRSQWWVLTYLFRQDGITQTELAELMELQKASLGRLLDRLESKQWIRREADLVDRRANRIFLTEDVQPLIAEMRKRAATVRRDALSGISAADREQFIDTLLKVKSNLSAMQADDSDELAKTETVSTDSLVKKRRPSKAKALS